MYVINVSTSNLNNQRHSSISMYQLVYGRRLINGSSQLVACFNSLCSYHREEIICRSMHHLGCLEEMTHVCDQTFYLLPFLSRYNNLLIIIVWTQTFKDILHFEVATSIWYVVSHLASSSSTICLLLQISTCSFTLRNISWKNWEDNMYWLLPQIFVIVSFMNPSAYMSRPVITRE